MTIYKPRSIQETTPIVYNNDPNWATLIVYKTRSLRETTPIVYNNDPKWALVAKATKHRLMKTIQQIIKDVTTGR